MHDNAAAGQLEQHHLAPAVTRSGPEGAGWAVRWQHALSAVDTARNTDLLRRMRIDNPVRAVLASGYTSADLWALRLYSLVKGWSPALTVSQVYDKTCRRAHMAIELSAQQDATGAMLAALEPEQAEQCISLALRHSPHASSLHSDPSFQAAVAPVRAAMEAAWQMTADLRGQPVHQRSSAALPAVAAPPAGEPDLLRLWQAVLAGVQPELPAAEFATWLAPSMLLSLEQQREVVAVVVGVPHVFARERLTTVYLARLSEVLAQLVGRPVSVQVEIDALVEPTPLLGQPTTGSAAT